jgi:hypothetical protein
MWGGMRAHPGTPSGDMLMARRDLFTHTIRDTLRFEYDQPYRVLGPLELDGFSGGIYNLEKLQEHKAFWLCRIWRRRYPTTSLINSRTG